MVVLGAGAGAGAVFAVWLDWAQILNVVDPLPSTRFVALMPMPADRPPTALLFTVLDSIGQRLSRAEAFVKNLMIITPQDKPGPAEAIDSPMKAETTLGANLVLVASLDQTWMRTPSVYCAKAS
jgi:hypothetical protein